jgi:CDP-paratose 2-epimerase
MTQVERVLVTGGAGFVGSHVVDYYATRGASVTALDNLSRAETLNSENDGYPDTASYNWRYIETNHEDVELVEGDVRDRELVMELVDGHDAIVHTAGQVAVTSSLADPRTDFQTNVEGTFNVLEAARQAASDPAVVFTSTNKVYGNNVNEIPVAERETRYEFDATDFEDGIDEAFDIDQTEHTPYGVSKLAADMYIQDYAIRNEVKAAAFRMSCIYGPRQFGSEDQGWVAHFTLSALRDTPVSIFGDGKQVRDVLYVTDLVRAFDAFLSAPEGKPAVYNVGGGASQTTSLLEFLDILEDSTGNRPEVTFDEWREGDQRVYISDISRASECLDWQPAVPLKEGIERYIDWYESTDDE